MIIRDVTAAELDAVLAINNAAVPNMNALDADAIRSFAESAVYFRVAIEQRSLAGFLIALDERAHYDSPNFRWFQDACRSFLYIDRIAVSESWQRRGIGKALYDDFISFAKGREEIERICAEVNLRPPNPGSIAFHETYGFERIGELDHPNEGKKVAMFRLELKPTA